MSRLSSITARPTAGVAFTLKGDCIIPLLLPGFPDPTVDDGTGEPGPAQGDVKDILSITGAANPQTGEKSRAPREGGQLRMVTVTEMGGPGRHLNVFG